MPASVHLVIPCYHESGRIGPFLAELCETLAPVDSITIRVVEDGSDAAEKQRMQAIIDAQRAKSPLLLEPLFLPQNLGKGGAIYAAWNEEKSADWLANADAKRRASSSLEICLKSQNLRESDDELISTGDFSITIRDGEKALETYRMSHRMTDGSGSHVDFLFAASADILRKIENTDAYARGNSDPPADVIYYILFDPELKGGAPLKSGDKAGSVTIRGLERALFKK